MTPAAAPRDQRALEVLADGLPEVDPTPGQLGLDGSMHLTTVRFENVDPQLVALILGAPVIDVTDGDA